MTDQPSPQFATGESIVRELDALWSFIENGCDARPEDKHQALQSLDTIKASVSETPQKPVDPESEAANPVWDLVIAKCHSAYPEREGMQWGESPLELITEIINERDELRHDLERAMANHNADLNGTTVSATPQKRDIMQAIEDDICELPYESPMERPDELTVSVNQLRAILERHIP